MTLPADLLDQVPHVDDDVVQRLRTLRDQVARPGEDVLGELLVLFARDSRLRLDLLKHAVATQSNEERRQAAHALKGSAGNVGAKRVSALAMYVEKNVVDLSWVTALETEVDSAIEALRGRLGLS